MAKFRIQWMPGRAYYSVQRKAFKLFWVEVAYFINIGSAEDYVKLKGKPVNIKEYD